MKNPHSITSSQVTMISASILPDAVALIQIKEGSRKLYIKAFNGLRKHLGNDLETRPPSEEELPSYLKFLRLEKGLFSSSLWDDLFTNQWVLKG